jgi:2-iminoacetate synthase
MALAKKGFIQDFCRPNAMLTFKEYLLDYASPATRQAGETLLAQELENYPDSHRKAILLQRFTRLEAGERDLYF